MKDLSQLLLQLKVEKPDLELFETAFTHRSFLNEDRKQQVSNERLEFLGDAILSFIVSEHLYRNFPTESEGKLTNMRASLVKTQTLGELAVELAFGDYLRLSKGEEEGGGRQNSSILADTFEAFLGAVFINGGLEAARAFLSLVLLPKTEEILRLKLHTDYKSKLQEIVQTFSKTAPTYIVVKTEGPDHAKQFWIRVVIDSVEGELGEGHSKQEAEQNAAMKELEKRGKL
jgi:ribonuclease-3